MDGLVAVTLWLLDGEHRCVASGWATPMGTCVARKVSVVDAAFLFPGDRGSQEVQQPGPGKSDAQKKSIGVDGVYLC